MATSTQDHTATSQLQPARKSWQEIGAAKRQDIKDKIAPWVAGLDLPTAEAQPNATKVPATVLSKDEVDITENYSAEQLVTSLARGDLTAVQTIKAFSKRAAVAHVLRAKELDEHLEKTGVPVGPLHGLPRFVSWLSNIDSTETESWLVKKLRDAGAIFYVKTNVPTSLMDDPCRHHQWCTNRKLAGASVRYPAGVNGVYGLRTSTGRLPYMGVANSMEGQEANPSTIGPMARNIQDLRFMMRKILAMAPWLEDPKCLPLPWHDDDESTVNARIASTGLTIGVLTTADELGFDGVVKCHPPVSRVLRETVAKLEAAGHHVIPFTPPAHSEGTKLVFECLSADGGYDVHKTLAASGEPAIPQVAISYGTALGERPSKSLNEWWALLQRKYAYQQRYLAYWNSTASSTRTGRPVDAVVLPLGPSASFEREKGFYIGYTALGNMLDVSAAAIPMDKVDKAKDVLSESDRQYVPISDLDRRVWESYNAETFDGTPVAIQVWTRKLEEEKALAIAQEVERIVAPNGAIDATLRVVDPPDPSACSYCAKLSLFGGRDVTVAASFKLL
ncbi:hypothetical protein FH972_023526 [Carpinus fangiana]|uniref:Amidase domain-containing protein n=1 Tax=Carpinus fangiana TaxID=176857 RepID=A0A5N6KXQ0_9ROSI|nr:hypothetical protein FH972_023526 [Carpinus fangiana]